MGLFRGRSAATGGFMHAVGWGRVGYRQEPIHVFNDEYTAVPLGGPFTVTWQGVQKHQAEADMDTEWNRWGFADGYKTSRLKSDRFQQYGAFNQFRGSWGPVPATAAMSVPISNPQSQGLLSDLVRAVKKAWTGANA